jgi:hypothetical protein
MTSASERHHNPVVACYRTLLLLGCAPAFAQQYTISTIAGNGVAGVYLHNPTSVALDSAADVYFADWNGLVRKICRRWRRHYSRGHGNPGI